jgi:hypothetical protein
MSSSQYPGYSIPNPCYLERMEGQPELDEAVEKAHAPFERRVGATIAIIAAVLALVSVSGHIQTTEELLLQQKASDQWAYYQSKSIRRYQSEFAADILAAVKDTEAAKRYQANFGRYEKDAERIQEQARDLQRESGVAGRRALRLHIGEIFLEMAIVFSSLAVLTRRNFFWWSGIAGGVIGSVVAATVIAIR